MARSRKGAKSNRIISSAAGIIAVIIGAVLLIYNNFYEKPVQVDVKDGSIFYMSVIDVGQGDSILLSVGDYDILIDAGDGSSGESVTGFLTKMGVEDIDMLVATHPHADHIGGMPTVFEKYTVKQVLLPEIPDNAAPTTATYERFIDCLTSSRANEDGNIFYAVPGDTYTFGELVLTVVSPVFCSDDYNNDSVVLYAQFGETSFMLMGDAEKEAEEKIISNGYAYKVDVLKVGHHGSSSSTSEDFLYETAPQYAAISCGRDNSYGHPHSETLIALDKYGIQTARTDLTGTIIYTSDGKEVTCHS